MTWLARPISNEREGDTHFIFHFKSWNAASSATIKTIIFFPPDIKFEQQQLFLHFKPTGITGSSWHLYQPDKSAASSLNRVSAHSSLGLIGCCSQEAGLLKELLQDFLFGPELLDNFGSLGLSAVIENQFYREHLFD